MMALSLFGSFIRLILKILLLPVQAVLTVLIAMVHFASGVLGLVCGIIGGLFVLLSFTYLFASPIDWKMFLEALIFGSIIGALSHIICYAGDTVLIAIKEFLDMI